MASIGRSDTAPVPRPFGTQPSITKFLNIWVRSARPPRWPRRHTDVRKLQGGRVLTRLRIPFMPVSRGVPAGPDVAIGIFMRNAREDCRLNFNLASGRTGKQQAFAANAISRSSAIDAQPFSSAKLTK